MTEGLLAPLDGCLPQSLVVHPVIRGRSRDFPRKHLSSLDQPADGAAMLCFLCITPETKEPMA